MNAESDLKTHRWYHNFFSRKLGTFYATTMNTETGAMARVARLVRYCPFCKADFHEGGPIQEIADLLVGCPPEEKQATPHLRLADVVPFEKKPE